MLVVVRLRQHDDDDDDDNDASTAQTLLLSLILGATLDDVDPVLLASVTSARAETNASIVDVMPA